MNLGYLVLITNVVVALGKVTCILKLDNLFPALFTNVKMNVLEASLPSELEVQNNLLGSYEKEKE